MAGLATSVQESYKAYKAFFTRPGDDEKRSSGQ